jgi:sulfide:quinone oxidoreductase
MTSSPFRVLVAGGGVAGIEALLTLHAIARERCELILADAQPDFVYRPMKVAEPFARGSAARHPLAAIAADIGAGLVVDDVVAVDDRERVATTRTGAELRYDALLLATGARAVPAFPHALNWDDRTAPEVLGGLLRDMDEGYLHRLAFVVPEGPGWPLPAYELALMAARAGFDAQTEPQISLITSEPAPLAVFGHAASEAVSAELRQAGVQFFGCAYAEVHRAHAVEILLHPGLRRIEVDRVVALPRLEGRPPAGIPTVADGFLKVDAHGKVRGTQHVWAAGDGIDFPVKFGGLAAEQADAAAEAIAAAAGASITPRPFHPVLRGRLLTGRGERYMHHVAGGGGGDGETEMHALWWPPSKIAGARLAPYLAVRDEAATLGIEPPPPGVQVQTDLTRELQLASH